jgi:hypothetical protein
MWQTILDTVWLKAVDINATNFTLGYTVALLVYEEFDGAFVKRISWFSPKRDLIEGFGGVHLITQVGNSTMLISTLSKPKQIVISAPLYRFCNFCQS